MSKIEKVEIKNVENTANKIAVEIMLAKGRQQTAARDISGALKSIKSAVEMAINQHDNGFRVGEGRFLEGYVQSLIKAVEELDQAAVQEKRLQYLVSE